MEFLFLGFFTGLSLILALGAQNVFVIEQGLKKQYVFIVCLICSISDLILIFLGIFLFEYFNDIFTKQKAIISSMTKKEKVFPDLIKASRKKRISNGSGTSVQDVNKLLKQFKKIKFLNWISLEKKYRILLELQQVLTKMLRYITLCLNWDLVLLKLEQSPRSSNTATLNQEYLDLKKMRH